MAEAGNINHFAWPYGRFHHFNVFATKAVFEAGFKTCASAERGCHTQNPDSIEDLCIRRDHISAHWPLNHIRYFLTRNAIDTSRQKNGYPAGWDI